MHPVTPINEKLPGTYPYPAPQASSTFPAGFECRIKPDLKTPQCMLILKDDLVFVKENKVRCGHGMLHYPCGPLKPHIDVETEEKKLF